MLQRSLIFQEKSPMKQPRCCRRTVSGRSSPKEPITSSRRRNMKVLFPSYSFEYFAIIPVEYVEEEEEDQPHLSGTYGTPSPIAHDPQLEEYRRAYMERECEGWCYSGGNCSVHVHPVTYAYIGKECRWVFFFNFMAIFWRGDEAKIINRTRTRLNKTNETGNTIKFLIIRRAARNCAPETISFPVLSNSIYPIFYIFFVVEISRWSE